MNIRNDIACQKQLSDGVRYTVRVLTAAAALVFARFADAAPVQAIRSVAVDRQSLNVAAGETITLRADFARAGIVSVFVVDRDGYIVRTLAASQPVAG
jgi:hypothetical protein